MIKIIRNDIQVDKDEVYTVYIDNMDMLEIYNGEMKNIDIKNGKHIIFIKSKNFCSKTITFSINSGEIIEFNCGPKYKNAVVKLFYKIVLLGKGIYLNKKMDLYI